MNLTAPCRCMQYVVQSARLGGRGALTNGELVETQHVHDPNLGDDRPKQVRPLVAAGCYQQPPVGTPLQHMPGAHHSFCCDWLLLITLHYLFVSCTPPRQAVQVDSMGFVTMVRWSPWLSITRAAQQPHTSQDKQASNTMNGNRKKKHSKQQQQQPRREDH